MADDVLLNKAASIERCVARAREEYSADPATFAGSHTRQDAAVLNIQRACEAALDMGQHLIRRERLGLPQSARDVFALLARAGWIDSELAAALQRMVGFRNIAVHEYLRVHPGNRLEAQKGKLKGFHSIRINDQWRLVFRWSGGQSHDVQIVDYHR